MKRLLVAGLIVGALLPFGVWAAGDETCGTLPFVPAISIPGTSFIAGQPTSIDCRTIGLYISGIYRFAMYAGAIAAALMIMVGGFLWLTSGGNATRVDKARTYIAGALSGYVLLLTSWVLLNTINPNLVRFKPLDIEVLDRKPLLQRYVEESCCVCSNGSETSCQTELSSSDEDGGVCVCGGNAEAGFSAIDEASCAQAGAPGECVFATKGLRSNTATSTLCQSNRGLDSSWTCNLNPGACGEINSCPSAGTSGCNTDNDCASLGQSYSCNHQFNCGSDIGSSSISGGVGILLGGNYPIGCCRLKGAPGDYCNGNSDCQSGDCSRFAHLLDEPAAAIGSIGIRGVCN